LDTGIYQNIALLVNIHKLAEQIKGNCLKDKHKNKKRPRALCTLKCAVLRGKASGTTAVVSPARSLDLRGRASSVDTSKHSFELLEQSSR